LIDILFAASSGGHLDLVERAIQYGAPCLSGAFNNAAWGGHRHIMLYLENKSIPDYETALVQAAYSGHDSIVEWMLESGATYYNDALVHASKGGHLSIVQRMVQLGARSFERALYQASAEGHVNVVEYLLSFNVQKAFLYQALHYACKHGRLGVVKLLLYESRPTLSLYDNLLVTAAQNGQLEIASLLINRGARDFYRAEKAIRGEFVYASAIRELLRSYQRDLRSSKRARLS
jgi:hypothetical protein